MLKWAPLEPPTRLLTSLSDRPWSLQRLMKGKWDVGWELRQRALGRRSRGRRCTLGDQNLPSVSYGRQLQGNPSSPWCLRVCPCEIEMGTQAQWDSQSSWRQHRGKIQGQVSCPRQLAASSRRFVIFSPKLWSHHWSSMLHWLPAMRARTEKRKALIYSQGTP